VSTTPSTGLLTDKRRLDAAGAAQLGRLLVAEAEEGEQLDALVQRRAGGDGLGAGGDEAALGDDALAMQLLVAAQLFRGEVVGRDGLEKEPLRLHQLRAAELRDDLAVPHELVRRDGERLQQAPPRARR
jgi:hypothetical protein